MSEIDLATMMPLSPGDVVEVPSLMSGLTPESALFQVESTTGSEVTFRVMFYGVYLTKAVLTKTDKGFSWTFN